MARPEIVCLVTNILALGELEFMAAIKYVGIGFYYFWQNISLTSLEDYSRRLGNAFTRHYQSVGFFEREFVRHFEPLLNAYDPHGNVLYRFDLQNKGCNERWEVKLRRTQITHLEGGTIGWVPNECNPNPEIGRALVEEGVASFVCLSEFAKKGLGRFLGTALHGSYVGDSASIYLWEKASRMRDLNRKLRWEAFEASDFKFYEFADRVATLVQPTGPAVVELSYLNDELRRFMQQCDDKLKDQLSATERIDLFRLVNLSPPEWFHTK